MSIRESKMMQTARLLKLWNIYRLLRRVYVPVARNGLVLEIGSGGNPYPRANVLLDDSIESYDRWERIVMDRPIVFAEAERMPFRDKVFDFVIASYVLEHTDKPEEFLDELQRVGRAGYIETPNAFSEKIAPYSMHTLELNVDEDDKIIIRKKAAPHPDLELTTQRKKAVGDSRTWMRFIRKHYYLFTMRYYWKESIFYEILNPDYEFDWNPVSLREKFGSESLQGSRMRRLFLSMVRLLLRPRCDIDWLSLLKCIECQSTNLRYKGSDQKTGLQCVDCGRVYPIVKGCPVMFLKQHKPRFGEEVNEDV